MAGRIITFQLTLHDETGNLSSLLTIFAQWGANILTINQTIPTNGCAGVTISADTNHLQTSLEEAFAVSQCHARRGPGGDSGRLTPQRYMLLYGSSWRLLGAAMLLSVSGFAGFFPGIRSPGHTAA